MDNETECFYCADLDRYGLLPADTVTIPEWTTMAGTGGGGTKRMHAPKYPVAGFKGIECQCQTT